MCEQSSKVKLFAAREEKYFQNLAREQKCLATPALAHSILGTKQRQKSVESKTGNCNAPLKFLCGNLRKHSLLHTHIP